MTISSENRKAGPFSGNGVTTQFPFSFKVFQASDLLVVTTDTNGVETTRVLNTDYTVTLNADQNANPGGTINYPVSGAPLANGYLLTATSAVQALQPTDLTNQGGFYPRTIGDALDRLTILVQQAVGKIARSIVFPISDQNPPKQLPTATERANQALGFDANGDPIAIPPGSAVSSAGAVMVQDTAGNYTAGSTVESALAQIWTKLKATTGTIGAALINFIQSGAGAVARTLQDRLAETVSVRDFGAKGDGVTNDAVAFTNALASGAKTIRLPAGNYFLSGRQFTIPVNVMLEGDGSGATTITTDYAGWLFFCKQGFKGIKGMTIQGHTTVQANAVAQALDMHTEACHQWKLEDIWFQYLVSAIDSRGSYVGKLEDVYVWDCGSSTAYAVYMGATNTNIQTNAIEYDNFHVIGDDNWNGKGLYTENFGHTFNELHIEHITNQDGWTCNAQGVVVNGGYFETHNGDGANQITINNGAVISGVLVNSIMNTNASTVPVIFNSCYMIYTTVPVINTIYNGTPISGGRAAGIMGNAFAYPARINKASMVKLKTVTQGTFEEYASGYNIPSDTAVGDYYGSSHTAVVTTTAGEFLTGTKGMKFTKTADTASGGSIGFTFNPAVASRKLCAWAIVKIPSACPNIQVSFGLGGYDFSDSAQLAGASYSSTNGEWALLIVEDFVPYSNYVTFNCNKVGGGTPPNGEYFLVDSFGVCEGGLSYDNLSNI